MSILEFISSLASSLAWPAVLVIAAILLRPELSKIFAQLAERVKYLKSLTGPGGTGAEFESGVLAAKQEVDAISGEPQAGPLEVSNENSGTFSEIEIIRQDLIRQVDASPRAAIIESWISLESSLRRLYAATTNRNDASQAPLFIVLRRVAQASESNLVNEALGAVSNLYTLRNQAAHEQYFDISPLASYDYANTAYRITALISAELDRLSTTDSSETGPGRP